ncbi:hypothetical protein PoB_005723300 [Plakobranchus ocellatus]|uniref:Uncharacterized protein n=1 Tax=Plakobranchus ocellatus TaxID=259542 RepID=A0AAV4CFK4_9GAST|nr:hypothetical protein PoB_005723300 [Plakobranchus ocellatus]
MIVNFQAPVRPGSRLRVRLRNRMIQGIFTSNWATKRKEERESCLFVRTTGTTDSNSKSRGKLEHLVTTGKFEGKRSRGRQREKIMDGLAAWLGSGKVSDILAAVKDRDLWRDMIANAYKQGT